MRCVHPKGECLGDARGADRRSAAATGRSDREPARAAKRPASRSAGSVGAPARRRRCHCELRPRGRAPRRGGCGARRALSSLAGVSRFAARAAGRAAAALDPRRCRSVRSSPRRTGRRGCQRFGAGDRRRGSSRRSGRSGAADDRRPGERCRRRLPAHESPDLRPDRRGRRDPLRVPTRTPAVSVDVPGTQPDHGGDHGDDRGGGGCGPVRIVDHGELRGRAWPRRCGGPRPRDGIERRREQPPAARRRRSDPRCRGRAG